MSHQLETGRAGAGPAIGHVPAHHRTAPVDFETLLGEAFVGEPPIGRGVAAVYQRADRMHRRRLQAVLLIGVVAAVLIAGLGYALTTVAVPDSVRRGAGAGAPAPAGRVDPVLMILRTAADRELRVMPREPSRGAGWRQYTVLSRTTGQPRGLIEVSVYTAPDGICFPVLTDPTTCARPERAGGAVEYVRYSEVRNPDWQVHQAMSRRLSDGRVLAVLATGERDTGNAAAGRPPLTPAQIANLAAGAGLLSAFGAGESCDGPDPACPLLMVPVPAGD
jgi:hypothetical protein